MTVAAADSPHDVDDLSRTRRWLTSTLLIVFTILAAAVCIILLSSTLTQSRLANLAIDGVGISIRKLDNVARQWVPLSQQRTKEANALNSAQSQLVELLPESTKAKDFFLAAQDELERLLASFYFRIKDLEPDLAGEIHNKGYPEQVGAIQGTADQLHTKRPELDPTVKSIESSYDRWRDAREKNSVAKAKFDVPDRQAAQLKKKIASTDQQLQAIFDVIKPNLDASGRTRVESAFYELNVDNYFSASDLSKSLPHRIIARVAYGLLTVQPDMLTLFLVIFMGVLGSALQITHSYFMKNQVQTVGGYFQRISVGAITALVIFIVAKAGVPVIADATKFGGEAPINPYLVSFLAIISGLLSENAIASVQAQGARFFGAGTDGPDRWARSDLGTELQAQNLSLTTLAVYLDETEKVVLAQLKGDEKIASAQQKVIAIYLRRDPRDIYTDIPPPSKS
jgi:hypothetical protein